MTDTNIAKTAMRSNTATKIEDALRLTSAERGIFPLYLQITYARRLRQSQTTAAEGTIATKIVAETLAGSLPKIYANVISTAAKIAKDSDRMIARGFCLLFI